MREALSNRLVKLVCENPKAYLLTGDHGYALFDALRKEKPDRFINAGVAEQNMVGVASGLSKMGFLPLVYGLSAFVPVRVLEQIKIDLCYDNRPCILLGDGAGVVYGQLGASHQSFEDISALRGVPNLEILSPADAEELGICFDYAVNAKKPIYLRLGKADLGAIHQQKISKMQSVYEMRKSNSSVLFVATGSMVSVACRLSDEVFNARVISVPRIKPFTGSDLSPYLNGVEKVMVFEEHSVFGGLGSAVSEIIAETGGPRVVRFGIEDQFSKKCGSYQYLMEQNGLSFECLKERINSIV